MSKLNRDQIIKALEHCINDATCEQCPYTPNNCFIQENALALVEELTEDNADLNKTISSLLETIKSIQADTVRKMQERLEAEAITIKDHTGKFGFVVLVSDIDQIAKEMLEGKV